MHFWPWLPQTAVLVPGWQVPAESQHPVLQVCWLHGLAPASVLPVVPPLDPLLLLPAPLDEPVPPLLEELALPPLLDPPPRPPSRPPRRLPSEPRPPPLLVVPLDDPPVVVPDEVPAVLPPAHAPALQVWPVVVQSVHCPDVPHAVSSVPPTQLLLESQHPLQVEGSQLPVAAPPLPELAAASSPVVPPPDVPPPPPLLPLL